MFKNFLDYKEHVSRLNRNKNDIDRHHILPVSSFWPNTPENIAEMMISDHRKVHQTLDTAYRYQATMVRKQRMRENGHIVLTQDDIDWRAEIQRTYLDWVSKLPNFLQDMHEVKLGELVLLEQGKLARLTNDILEVELWDTMENHQTYIEIQKEISKTIYDILKQSTIHIL